jgi:hypothetical protein
MYIESACRDMPTLLGKDKKIANEKRTMEN